MFSYCDQQIQIIADVVVRHRSEQRYQPGVDLLN